MADELFLFLFLIFRLKSWALEEKRTPFMKFYLVFIIVLYIIRPASGQICRRFSSSNRPSYECTNAHLTSPPHIPDDVLVVTLFNNSMRTIESFPDSYRDVQSLNMQYCGIERIAPSAWEKLESLRYLDLSHNALSNMVLPPSLKNLNTLSLAHNNLRFLPDLSGLTSLRVLDVSFNTLYRANPRSLPPNVQSLQLSHNRLSTLIAWPHLKHIQELDISSNPLKCECSLWEWIEWASQKSLVHPSTIPCDPSTNRTVYDPTQSCGPEIEHHTEVDIVQVSVGEPVVICCMVSALPAPALHWIHDGIVIGRGTTQKNIPDTGRMRHCLEMDSLQIDSYGEYFCVATLGHRNVSKRFLVERHKEPLVLKTPTNFIFYAQFSLILFVVVFCGASYCIIRRDRTRHKTEDFYRTHVVQVINEQQQCEKVPNEISDNLIETSQSGYQEDEEWGSPWHPKAVYTYTLHGPIQAPLARFDPDSRSILALSNTAV